MSYWGFPRYVSVGEKQQRAKRKLEQLMKKNKDIKPVILAGNTLAKTWWGKAWNKNLEGYADYSNRIGRGRSYVRCGSVLDLQIREGMITSLVQGSDSSPYSIKITINMLERNIWEEVKDFCKGKLDSMQELLMGKFPKTLDELFTAHGKGLFPSPKEIKFDCSCPDWASMCKHIAATLYGVGARLDDDPNLFFLLRKIEIDDLISETVKDKTEELLTRAKRKSSRIIEDQDLSYVFGIEMDTTPDTKAKTKAKIKGKDVAQKKASTATKTSKVSTKKPAKKSISTGKKKAALKSAKKTSKANTVKKPVQKAVKKTPAKSKKTTKKTIKKK
ncbi:hypothetical protein [uncultured Candidatus Kuenenia sp.]|uniref:SWIM zinc finger family protein n=1 Tax=uncultured Candidatus Kuenenia sp. TaxID=1048336 RepID=UPI0002FC7607|nr:hypothetical protein [uncultured Candidatus Kuenenia sp.]